METLLDTIGRTRRDRIIARAQRPDSVSRHLRRLATRTADGVASEAYALQAAPEEASADDLHARLVRAVDLVSSVRASRHGIIIELLRAAATIESEADSGESVSAMHEIWEGALADALSAELATPVASMGVDGQGYFDAALDLTQFVTAAQTIAAAELLKRYHEAITRAKAWTKDVDALARYEICTLHVVVAAAHRLKQAGLTEEPLRLATEAARVFWQHTQKKDAFPANNVLRAFLYMGRLAIEGAPKDDGAAADWPGRPKEGDDVRVWAREQLHTRFGFDRVAVRLLMPRQRHNGSDTSPRYATATAHREARIASVTDDDDDYYRRLLVPTPAASRPRPSGSQAKKRRGDPTAPVDEEEVAESKEDEDSDVDDEEDEEDRMLTDRLVSFHALFANVDGKR